MFVLVTVDTFNEMHLSHATNVTYNTNAIGPRGGCIGYNDQTSCTISAASYSLVCRVDVDAHAMI
jgi:hypothetical protein